MVSKKMFVLALMLVLLFQLVPNVGAEAKKPAYLQFKAGACSTTYPCIQAAGLSPRAGPALSPALPPGEVLPVGVQTALRFLQAVARGDPGTFIMQGPLNQWLFAFYMGKNCWGFMGVTRAGAPLANLGSFQGANRTSVDTFSTFIKNLENSGWKYKLPVDLPATILGMLTNAWYTLVQWGSMLSSPAFYIFPLAPNEVFTHPSS